MAGAIPTKPRSSAGPYISASASLPEITLKGVLLGLFLSVLLGAANTYLGLKAGLTVAAAIPAAVVSMAILKAFRRNNILENNMVQTIASAGTAVASGAIFTIPALIILGKWTEINYLETTAVAICGGLLGVLFTVPIRRALIIEEKLPFPEGVATGEVLIAGAKGGAGIGVLAVGGASGAIYKFMEGGLKMFEEAVGGAVALGQRAVLGFGMNLSPALFGVGAIIGLRIAILVFLGGVLGWFVGIPLYTQFAGDVYSPVASLGNKSFFDLVDGKLDDLPGIIWSRRIRYIGVGAMLVGGVWSLIKLRKPLSRAIKQGVDSARSGKTLTDAPRTERELPYKYVGIGVATIIVPITILYGLFTNNWVAAVVMAAIMAVTGFLFSAVGAYMAGLVGSSNTPISGVTILTLIVSSFALLALGIAADVGPAAAVLVASVIAVAGSIASDNLQDLKAGHVVGATPWKQQLMLMVGATASAFAIAPVMQILINGAGGPSAIGSASLPAPQAGLMAAVSKGIFGDGLPYDLVAIGAVLAVVLILTDAWLKRVGSSFGTPVMPVAVGIYLPVGLSVPILLGGLVAEAVTWFAKKRGADEESTTRNVVLMGSGLIAGEAIMGILTSILQASFSPSDATPWMTGPLDFLHHEYNGYGLLLFAYLAFLAWYMAIRPAMKRSGKP